MKTLCVVVPVHNDWTSFSMLLERLDHAAARLPMRVFVTAVDDGSTEPTGALPQEFASLAGVEIIRLHTRSGHQRAIAVGLCVAVHEHAADAIVVMDGDGEDRPESLATLLAEVPAADEFTVVAERRKRMGSASFDSAYFVYKHLFRTLTGLRLNFGNYSLFSRGHAERLTHMPELWNHLAASVLRSGLPVHGVPVDRGRRYAGRSHMNFTALAVHGLSGLSVHADTIVIRILSATAGLLALGAVVGFGLLVLHTHAAGWGPRWLLVCLLAAAVSLLQMFSTAFASALLLLHRRSQPQSLPSAHFRGQIAERIWLGAGAHDHG